MDNIEFNGYVWVPLPFLPKLPDHHLTNIERSLHPSPDWPFNSTFEPDAIDAAADGILRARLVGPAGLVGRHTPPTWCRFRGKIMSVRIPPWVAHSIVCLVPLPDGRLVACSQDAWIYVWSPELPEGNPTPPPEGEIRYPRSPFSLAM